jgi:putative pyruvate formate lyase activating enzyme
VLKWIAENIRDKCIVNIMDQYRPYFKAMEQTDVNRRITGEEFKEVLDYATALGINYLK